MRTVLISGLLFFFGSIFLIENGYKDFHVFRNGIIVKMKILSLPASCPTAKVRYEVKFTYKGVIYRKQLRGGYCEDHYPGEFVEIKMAEGFENVLLPKEPGFFNFLASIILGLFGLFIAISSLIKINKSKKKIK
jgi:hypothetical protein